MPFVRTLRTHSAMNAMRMPGIVLAILCGGCGSSVPDESASPQSPPIVGTSLADNAGAPLSLPAGDRTLVEKKIQGNVNGTASINQSGDHTSASMSSIPVAVEKDLHSLEARDRNRALDYWEAKDNKAPLDLVFEAMEDDDPAVRAKATAIVERYWAAEQEKEQG